MRTTPLSERQQKCNDCIHWSWEEGTCIVSIDCLNKVSAGGDPTRFTDKNTVELPSDARVKNFNKHLAIRGIDIFIDIEHAAKFRNAQNVTYPDVRSKTRELK